MPVCEMSDSCEKRFERVESDIKLLQNQGNDVNVRQARMETTLDYIKTEVKEMNTTLTIFIAQPGKRWDNVVTILITSGIVGLVTFFFAKGGRVG